MKELLKRLRFWLIKKLGGETHKVVVNACPEIRTIPVHTQVIVPAYSMLKSRLTGEETYRCVKRQLSEQLAEYLLNDDTLCNISQSTDIVTDNIVFRMSIHVQPKGQVVNTLQYEMVGE